MVVTKSEIVPRHLHIFSQKSLKLADFVTFHPRRLVETTPQMHDGAIWYVIYQKYINDCIGISFSFRKVEYFQYFWPKYVGGGEQLHCQ